MSPEIFVGVDMMTDTAYGVSFPYGPKVTRTGTFESVFGRYTFMRTGSSTPPGVMPILLEDIGTAGTV
jgi:hypothetical protein